MRHKKLQFKLQITHGTVLVTEQYFNALKKQVKGGIIYSTIFYLEFFLHAS